MRNVFALVAGMLAMHLSINAQPIETSDVGAFKFRNIGPATTSGRVADIAVNPNNTSEWYVAAASGGVWKTTNAGSTFTPIFDGQGSYSIGCVTMDPSNPHTIWVGTGENNNQRSVAYGDGVYVSHDGGSSWKNVGLKTSEHIGMIKVHPENSNVVYVAAYGPLWSAGEERGLYKTEDGGATWKNILEIDEHTGINEVHFDPRNPDVIYATAHQRRRHVYTYVGGGPGSAIYKSTNGGVSFEKLAGGLPNGKMGRIGMAVSPVNPDYVFAIIEAQDGKGGFYKSTNRGASWSKLDDYKTSGNYYQELFCDPTDIDKVFAMDTYAHVTRDGGKTWKRLGEKNKHVDNHCMWINPQNTDQYIMGCDGGLYQTYNDAKDWEYYPNLPITQFYRVTVDNAKPFYFVYGGTQDNFSLGGPNQTRKTSGIDNYDWFVTNNGDGFESQIDPGNPNIIYAQAQYGWLVRFDKQTGQKVSIQPQPGKNEAAYRWNWDAPLLISPHKPERLYFCANKVFRSEDRGNSWTVISDDLSKNIDRNGLKTMGEVQSIDAVMLNKSTSIYGNIVAFSESPLQENLLYAGTDDGNIHRSDDGQNWTALTWPKDAPDNVYVNDIKADMHDANTVYLLLNNHKNGDFKPYIYKSTDKGKSWTSIAGNLPERGSVYSLAQDHMKDDLLFVGTEFGIFTSIDAGANWAQLKGGLPTIAIRDIDLQRDEDDIVVATFGRGFYVMDDYSPLREMTEDTKKEEIKIFGIRDGLVFAQNSKYGYGGAGFQGASFWLGDNPEMGTTITYYLKEAPKSLKAQRQANEKELVKAGESVSYPNLEMLHAEDDEEANYMLVQIFNADGEEVRRMTKKPSAGIHRLVWDGRLGSNASLSERGAPFTKQNAANMALPGVYSVQLSMSTNGKVETLSKKVAFKLKALKGNALDYNEEALAEFQAELETVRKRANGADQYFEVMQERLKSAKASARNTTGVSLEVLNQLRGLELEMNALNRTMYGDQSLSSRDFEAVPGIMDRIGLAVWVSYSNQADPTQTQRDDVKITSEMLDEWIPEVKAINTQLVSIEEKLQSSGAPYFKSTMPNLE